MKTMKRFALLTVLVMAGTIPPAQAITQLLKDLEDSFVKLSEEVRPCVVTVEVKGKREGVGGRDLEQYEDLFRFFGMPRPQERAPRRMPPAVGSGFIYSKDGLIITNNHVVEDADEIKVTLYDNQKYAATVVGRDPDTDIAVIKIEANRDLPVARLGDSAQVKVGQFAIAMGSPRGFEGSISFGHISALGRDEVDLGQSLRFKNFIQTDAAINLGNSGGPLVNVEGEVIGINTAIVWGAESLGFAIPINKAKEILPELIAKGKVVRGYLGVQIQPVAQYKDALGLPDDLGAYVREVQVDTPAGRAGIQYDDVIRKVNGEVVKNPSDLVDKISRVAPGSKTQLEIWRKGAPLELVVTVDEFPQGGVREVLKGKDTLGLRVQSLTPDLMERLGLSPGTKGVVVSEVLPDSTAYDAGIERGDVILEVGQQPVANPTEFRDIITKKAVPGKPLLIRIMRGGDRPMPILLEVPKDYKPN